MAEDKKYSFKGKGLSDAEKKRGKRLFDKYCQLHDYEKISDLEVLESLVFHELLIDRLKDKMEETEKSKTVDEKHIVPKWIMEQLRDLEDQQLKLKEKLGLFTDNKIDSPLKALELLFKKFEIWREHNQASREIVCPFCSQLFFLKIRTDKYEAYKTPFFEDKILINRPLYALYKTGKITIAEMANVLGVSEDYVKWLEEKFFQKAPDLVNPSL